MEHEELTISTNAKDSSVGGRGGSNYQSRTSLEMVAIIQKTVWLHQSTSIRKRKNKIARQRETEKEKEEGKKDGEVKF